MIIRQEYSLENIRRSSDCADELNVMDKMVDWIQKDNDYVCKCPLCEFGWIYCTDELEKIGYCINCFEEFKLL